MSVSLLRRLDPARDAAALHEIFGDRESCRYLSEPACASVAETAAALHRYAEGCEETSWAVAQGANGPALGRVAMIARGRDVWEAACMMRPSARGRGLAAAALGEALDLIFEQRAARRVFADIDPDNAASRRLFARLGFREEGVLRANWETHLGVRDSVIMALIDSDPRPWRVAAL